MALLKVHNTILYNDELFDVLLDAFDTMEKIGEDRLCNATIFRVSHEEITKEDVYIGPIVYRFVGVRPFVIEWDD